MKISVIGTGYVGLVVGTGLAENGHNVRCVDMDAAKIARLNKGEIPIYEPGLEELIARNIEEERLAFTTDLNAAVGDCLMVFICVGTPRGEDGRADTTDVFKAAEAIGKAINGYRVIVTKSTCPVGTTDAVRKHIQQFTQHDFDVVSNPEFLRQGAAVDDFMRPDRVVVGADDVRVVEIMRELYAPFLRTGKPFIALGTKSAEMAKYATNAMLATRISFMNELSVVCEAYGADIDQVREVIAMDSRIGPAYLFPGLGYGGSCLPKDVAACASLARDKQLPSPLLDAVNQVNRQQRERFVQRIREHYGNALHGKRIAVWGASFKPKTDDLRDGPALTIIDAMLADGAHVAVYDPVAMERLEAIYNGRIELAKKNYDALSGADGLVIVTEWNEFRRPDYARMGEMMRERVIFDGRNLYTPGVLAKHGFRYYSIGRPAV
ncbi:MAG: UDP-glucose 6-dehydrogenase [Candidatus Hydrogenedentota bacterium]